MKPTVGKIVAASILSAGVLGGGAALGIATTYDSPERAHYKIDAPTHSNSTLRIHNPDGVLTADDERILERDAARLEVPDVVKQLHYIVFADNDDNVNDTVETTCAITTRSSSARIVLPTAHCLLAWGSIPGKLSFSLVMTSQSYSICATAAI